MKKNLYSTFLIIGIAVVFSACKNNVPKEAKYIPKDAGFVLILDPQQMQDKLQKGGISIDTLIARIFKNEPADSKDRSRFNGMKDSAGINWGNKFFVFMTQKSNADKTQSSTFSLIGSLKDAAKFEAFVKKQDEHKNAEIKKEKDYSYFTSGEGSVMIAWNDEQLIMTMYNHLQKPVYDTVAMTFKKPVQTDTEGEMKREV
ncbi:MAG: DUF4836 family protein, partial [Sediminibacterium sp.]